MNYEIFLELAKKINTSILQKKEIYSVLEHNRSKIRKKIMGIVPKNRWEYLEDQTKTNRTVSED